MKPTRYKKAKKNLTDKPPAPKEAQSKKKGKAGITSKGLPHPPSVPIKPA